MSAPKLAEVLSANRDPIVSRFVSELKERHVSPEAVPRSLLVDHIPSFIDEMIAAFAGRHVDGESASSGKTPREHGEQR